MLYALTTSDLVEALLVDRRWSRRRFTERVGLLLRTTLLDESGSPAGADAN
jgi:hypothetical protein